MCVAKVAVWDLASTPIGLQQKEGSFVADDRDECYSTINLDVQALFGNGVDRFV